jgi:protein-tyrosine-phosphatase/DNA-binding transcriptional ArsR family regulator
MPETPPAVFELLGHPIRWALVRALASTDLRVGELVSQVGERQNLVSYHLRQLRQARLVAERRSSADARDVYYALDLAAVWAALDRSAGALHPALRLVSEQGVVAPGAGVRSRVLFVCTGNSARSQIAEALLNDLGRGALDVASAGHRPAGVHPLALRVLTKLGLPTGGLRSKGLDEVAAIDFDHVVTLCDVAREECPDLLGEPRRIHWSLRDPAAVDGPEALRLRAFEQTASELRVRIAFALPLLAGRGSSAA